MPEQTPDATEDTDGAKVRNMTGEPRDLPVASRIVQPNDLITLPRLVAERLAEQPGWDLVVPHKPTSRREE
ncbi:hypothetical protein [Actinocrispum wychmicini]|uniref:Uncharacterized protein n=1 Tax=Actinocrispum wychmicini TaxID=1213861 RepID=A0A4V2S5Z9_9PSEU|nr:hypothetical protein [Actinocrispum wychmicini]TCO54140.1 hypothetical protein EV192_109120 [Actinocrispum wychmicini]